MEGAKAKKRALENDARLKSPKKAKGDKKGKESGGKQRKRKVKKDTGVKRSCSAYIYFTQQFRQDMKKKAEKDGGATLPKANEMAKLAGEKWKKLTPEERKPFDVMAEKDRSRYMQESGKLQKEKEVNPKPKRAPTAYFIFLESFRKEIKESGSKTEGNKIPALAGERWREMTDADKAPFKEKEAKAKGLHLKAMEEWRQRQKELGLDQVPVKKPAKAAPAPKKSKPPKKVQVVQEEEEDDESEEEEDDDDEEEEEEDDEGSVEEDDDEDDEDDDDDE